MPLRCSEHPNLARWAVCLRNDGDRPLPLSASFLTQEISLLAQVWREREGRG